MKKRFVQIFASLACLVGSAEILADDFQIKNGDRVVFLGDSITEQRLYTTYIEAYALTRHPNWKLSFRNVGWGGDTSWLRQRARQDEGQLFAADDATQQAKIEESVGRGLERDVLPLNPTFVTVKFGMNDHSYQKFRPDIYRAYSRSQSQIAKVLGGKGARVAFITPQPIEDKRPDPQNDVRNKSLRMFAVGGDDGVAGLKDIAAKNNAAFVDIFDPFMDLMLAARAKNPEALIGFKPGSGDAVHPGPPGQTLMAWQVLKQIGATPLVSRAEINVTTKQTTTEGCRIDRLEFGEGNIRFDRLDECLPMPIDSRAESILELAPVVAELSRYEIQITGLPEGTYELTIDAESAGKVSAEKLAAGWNLTTVPGPVTAQSQEILKSIFKKNDLYFGRWRNVQLYSFPKWVSGPEIEAQRGAEMKRIDAEIAEVEAQIDARRKPVSRKYEIRKVN